MTLVEAPAAKATDLPKGYSGLVSAGGDSSQRPGDSDTAALVDRVKLKVVQDQKKRSYTKRSELQTMNPSAAFTNYCKEILQRIKRDKGIRMEDGEVCHFDRTAPEGKMFRARAERDNRFREQLRKAMREVYPTCIGDLTSIDDYDGLLNWADHMNEHAIQSKEAIAKHGNPKPKSLAQRENAPPKYRVVSENASDSAGNSVRLSTVPGYDAARRQAELMNVQARAQTAYRSDDRRAPSDGRGCYHCGGNHYARDCRWRNREPY